MESTASASDATTFWRALLHRWLVEFNPLYLLSAALVLAGTFLCSKGLAADGSLYGSIGVAAVAELYALALIGGAAILVRLGHRRPAVMLALLTVLYQSDLTLHTETAANLGAVGAWASLGWSAFFVAKLFALRWALRLRFSRSAIATALVAGAGLAAGPFVLQRNALGSTTAGALVAIWAFSLASLQQTARVESVDALDAWGETVKRRALLATWTISGGLLAGHVLFWSGHTPIALGALVPVAPLVLVRRLRRERHVWTVAGGTLALVALFAPSLVAMTSLLAAAALVLRATSPAFGPPAVVAQAVVSEQPYRAGVVQPVASASPVELVTRAEALRFSTGALFALHFAVWTFGWRSGPLPEHVLALDLALTAAVLLFASRTQTRLPLAGLATTWTHAVVVARLVPAPKSAFQWGATALVVGFALLGASLAATWRLRRT